MLRQVLTSCWALLATAILAVGCQPSPAADRTDSPRLVLLYATCTLNKDFLSPYNPGVPSTPALDQFARSSLVFRRHQTEAGQSGVAFASLFTGTQATQHGIFRHPTRLSDEAFLISEAFAAAGFDTFAWLDHVMASAELNYAQGVPPDQTFDRKFVSSDPSLRKILERLASDPEYKAFIVVNFTVTHGPYRGRKIKKFCMRYPEECEALTSQKEFEHYRKLYRDSHLAWSFDFERTAEERGLGPVEIDRLAAVIELLYKADVFRLDEMFGRVIAALDDDGLLEQSLIAFTSDHGEVHRRETAHFLWTHGWQLAPEVLNVAFLLYGKDAGVKPGFYEGVSRSIDVFPTLAGLAGIELPEIAGFGVDLSPSVRGETAEPELLAFSHTSLFADEVWSRYGKFRSLSRLYDQEDPGLIWTAVRDGDFIYKLHRPTGKAWEAAAFDLAVDSAQKHNLFDPDNMHHRERTRALIEYRNLLAGTFTRGKRQPAIDSERAVELLRALGYIE